jgi:hypothetical protein
MSICPDTDTLTSVCSALHWKATTAIGHIASCDVCQEQIEFLESVHRLVSEEKTISARLSARIDKALAIERAVAAIRPLAREPRSHSWQQGAVVAPLASLATFLMLYFAVQTGVSLDASTTSNVTLSVVLGLMTGGWTCWQRARREPIASLRLLAR